MTTISKVAVNQFLSISRKRKLTMWNSVFLLLNLHYSTLILSSVILTAYLHHRFITMKDPSVVISVVRNLDNIRIL